jgi:PAS domain S-box-containing protein
MPRNRTLSRPQSDELASSADCLRVAEKALDFGAWDWELGSNRVNWSPSMEALYGLAPGSFGGTVQDFTHQVLAPDRERVTRLMQAFLASGQSFEMEFRIRHTSGAVRWICARGESQCDASGKVGRVVGVNIDVTAAKTLHAEAETNAARLATALKLSELLIFRQDRQLRYSWIANPALGVPGSDLIGRNDDEVLGRDAARPLTTIKRRVLRSGRGERQEVWVTRGRHRGCFDLIVEPERGADGKVSGLLCAAADITARKQAEQERDEARIAVGRLADHLQDELEAQRRELAREVHDAIGATLTGIRLRVDALAQRVGTAATEWQEIRTTIDQALRSTRELCAQLRPPILDDLSFAAALRWYLGEWSRHSGIRARLRISAPAVEPAEPLSTDLFRMLQELLTDVARHSGAGSVNVSLARRRGGLCLRLRDDGRGFDPTAATGFGLLGIRERLRRHGGALDIRPSGTGTAIELRIPGAG